MIARSCTDWLLVIVVDFPSFVPAIFINMIIAISLDYGLFMLTRYGEEVRRGQPNLEAVKVALSRAGRVVFVSGVTLGLTNAGLTFCTVDVVASIGWGGACACLVAVTVHLTLLPALLVICGPCCRPFAHIRCTRNNCRHCSFTKPSDNELLSPLAGGRKPSSDAGAEAMWLSLGKFCRDHRGKIITLLSLSLIPFLALCFRYESSVNGEMLTPHKAPSMIAMNNISSVGINAGTYTPGKNSAMKVLPTHIFGGRIDLHLFAGAGALNPVVVMAYNLDGPAAAAALEPRCHDDDTQLRLLLDGIDLQVGETSVKSLPAKSVTCATLKTVTKGEVCTSEHLDGVSIGPLAQAYCAGTCSNLCDAAGYGNLSSARARR